MVIWDQHATPGGIFSLFICIAGGMVYEQSPMRGEKQTFEPPAADDDAFKADVSTSGGDDEGEDVSLLERGTNAAATKRRV